MKLNQIKDNAGATKNPIRVGRGIGSGKGKTAGRGHKGQKARTGVAVKAFEGGQMPIHRRLPKRGFTNNNRVELGFVNTGALQNAIDAKRIKAGETLTEAALIEKGLARANDNGIKLLAKGELTVKLTLEVSKASKAAIALVEKAGGKVTLIEKAVSTPAEKKKSGAKAEKADAPKAKSAKAPAAKKAKKSE